MDENSKDSEERIETNKRRQNRNSKSIFNERTESRQNFLEIKQCDPREKLAEQQIQRIKERRQNNIKENRSKKKEKIKNDHQLSKIKKTTDIKQLSKMIKLISEALDSFMLCTKKEIENMKKIGELNHECINIDREKMYKLSGILEERDNHFEEKYEQQ